MPKEFSVCPICLEREADHNHHIIPREIIFNGIKGSDGPTIDLCPGCHDRLHWQALNLLSKNPKKVVYFDDEQMNRASKVLAVLVAAIEQSRQLRDPGQRVKMMVSFTRREMDLIHLIKADAGYSKGRNGNSADLVHDLTMRFVMNHLVTHA